MMQILSDILTLIKINISYLLLLSLVFCISLLISNSFNLRRYMLPLVLLLLCKIIILMIIALFKYYDDLLCAFIHCCYEIRDICGQDAVLLTKDQLFSFRRAIKSMIVILRENLLSRKSIQFESMNQMYSFLFANIRSSLDHMYNFKYVDIVVRRFFNLIQFYKNPSYKYLYIILYFTSISLTKESFILLSQFLTYSIIIYSIMLVITLYYKIFKHK